MISDERFFAWLDGELAPDEAAAVEKLVAADPELRAKAEVHRNLGGRLRAAFDPVASAPVPTPLLHALKRREAEVVDFAAHTAKARPISKPTQWAAMAATLAIGLVAGSMIGRGNPSPLSREKGQLVASGELEQALYTRLASAPADHGARIVLTFRDTQGDLCRTFNDEGVAGLACHQQGDWRIRGLFQSGEAQQSEFRMAAGADPRLAELVDTTIKGEPLDAAAERKALDALR